MHKQNLREHALRLRDAAKMAPELINNGAALKTLRKINVFRGSQIL
jgi:hypothetical protein